MPVLIKDGQKKYFSIQDTGKARSEGWIYADPTVKVNLAGQQFDVPSEQADLVLQHPQITFADPSDDFAARQDAVLEKEFEDTGSQISAFAEGFGRTLSFGLTDVANRALGEDANDIRQRRERNTSALVGELSAIIPSIFIGGGTGALGKAGALIPAGQAARLGSAVQTSVGGVRGAIAAGVTEGALFGVGQGITNLTISDKPLAASAVIEELGWNALVGAGTGALAGAVTGGLARSAEKIKSRRIQEAVLAEAEQGISQGLKTLDNVHKTVTKELTSSTNINKQLFDERFLIANETDDLFKPYLASELSVSSRLARSGVSSTELQGLYKSSQLTKNSLQKAISSGEFVNASKLLRSYEKQLSTIGNKLTKVAPELFESVSKVDGNIALPLTQKGVQGGQELSQKLIAAREPLKALSKPLTEISPKEALQIASGLDDYSLLIKQADDATQKLYSNEIQGLVDNWSSVISKGLPESVNKSSGTELLKMMAASGVALDLEGDLVESIPLLGPAADTFIKLWLASKALGPVGKAGVKKVKSLAEKSQILSRIGGRAAGRLGATAGRQSAGTLGDAAGYTLGAKLGSNVVDGVLGVGHGMQAVATRVQDDLTKITSNLLEKTRATKVGARLGPVIFSEITSENNVEKGFEEFINNLQVDTDSLNMEALTHGNSEVSDLVHQQLTKTRDYLLSISPKNPVENSYLSGIKWKPSKTQLLEYSLAVSAAFKPTETLFKLNGGTLHPVEAQTLRELHPRYVEKLKENLLTQDINKLSKHDKLQLAILFDIPIGYDINVGMFIQQMFIPQQNNVAVTGNYPNQYTTAQETIRQ